MDLEAVKALAELMEQKGLSSIEVCEGDHKISLKKSVEPAYLPVDAPRLQSAPQAAASVAQSTASVAPAAGELDFNGVKELKSPMVGVAYAATEPGAEPFVKVGGKVKKGQVLCIIEAMKLMNEFTASEDGEIVDICFEDGQLVEYGQCLFKIF